MSIASEVLGDIGSALGGIPLIGDGITEAFSSVLRLCWSGGLAFLGEAFRLVDALSVFDLSVRSGPVATVWPLMMWLSGAIALGLFFAQILMTALRGGRGFLRVASGPVQYGAALALTVGFLGGLLAAADGASEAILSYGLGAHNFQDVLRQSTFLDSAVDTVKAVVLFILAVVMVIPTACSLILEMVFRQAAILVLVATIPITAAGLVHGATAGWFWRSLRWSIAAIVVKPALALVLVIGVGSFGGAKGVIGLLAGAGVLLLSVGTPWVLFKLLAFVDPNTDAGAAFRDALSNETGISPFPTANPKSLLSPSNDQQQANKARFDQALSTQDTEEGLGGGGGSTDTASGSRAHESNPDAGVTEAGGGAQDWTGAGGDNTGTDTASAPGRVTDGASRTTGPAEGSSSPGDAAGSGPAGSPPTSLASPAGEAATGASRARPAGTQVPGADQAGGETGEGGAAAAAGEAGVIV